MREDWINSGYEKRRRKGKRIKEIMNERRRKVWKNRQLCFSRTLLSVSGFSLPSFSIQSIGRIFKGQWSNQNAEPRRSVEYVDWTWPAIETPSDKAQYPWSREFLAAQFRLSEDSNGTNMLLYFSHMPCYTIPNQRPLRSLQILIKLGFSRHICIGPPVLPECW